MDKTTNYIKLECKHTSSTNGLVLKPKAHACMFVGVAC